MNIIRRAYYYLRHEYDHFMENLRLYTTFFPYYRGIRTEKKAKLGPKTVQLDITNNCNLNCVGCWIHSDLMGKDKYRGEKKKRKLSYAKIKQLLDEFEDMGVREIHLAGEGDPSMHPQFMKILEYIKKRDMKINLNTNFTLFTKKKIKELVKLDVDYITLSLWAGDPKTYVKTHPNQTKKTFHRIKENLKYIHSIKKENNLPQVKIYNVISSLNYNNIEKMIDFALETKVDHIEFQIIDIVEGKSDSLKLKQKHKRNIKEQFNNIQKKKEYFTDLARHRHLKVLGSEHKEEFREFGRFFKNTLPKGFRLQDDFVLEDETHDKMYCPHGQPSNGGWDAYQEPLNAIVFNFKRNNCKKCSGGKPFKIKQEYLRVLGVGSFLRRIEATKKSKKTKYETNIVDTFPCYVGWTYTRILSNGEVLPCCKAHNKPLGNIHKKSFRDIWFSNIYNKFRYMAKTKKKNHPYFREIDCYKSCDNLGMNLETHRRMLKFRK